MLLLAKCEFTAEAKLEPREKESEVSLLASATLPLSPSERRSRVEQAVYFQSLRHHQVMTDYQSLIGR